MNVKAGKMANSSAHNRGRRIATFLIVVFFVMDVFPSHGPPAFRYTGADPSMAVWNLGWPMPLAIYDPQRGFHIGPSLYIVVAAQLSLIVVIELMLAALRWRRTKTSQKV